MEIKAHFNLYIAHTIIHNKLNRGFNYILNQLIMLYVLYSQLHRVYF